MHEALDAPVDMQFDGCDLRSSCLDGSMLCSLQRREPLVIDYVEGEGVLLHLTRERSRARCRRCSRRQPA
jgi:hypothetical protein